MGTRALLLLVLGLVPAARASDGAFVATQLDAGPFYARLDAALGLGVPFHRSLALETRAQPNFEGWMQWLGMTATWPGVTVRSGVRGVFPADRTFLLPRERYTRFDTEVKEGPRAVHAAFESELEAQGAAGHLQVSSLLTAVSLLGIPDGRWVVEERLRVVTPGGWVLRARGGAAWRFGPGEAFTAGAAAEVIWVAARGTAVLRAGPQLGARLGERLELLLSILPAWSGPDALGLAGGDVQHLGVRWRWDAPLVRAAPPSAMRADPVDARDDCRHPHPGDEEVP
jgi:hypothetical protein